VPPTLLLDLDGTLVDTVPDLSASLNRLMVSRGLKVFRAEEVAPMVGDGVARLVEKAFAGRGLVPDAAAVADFSDDYTAHVAVGSRPYPGVAEALSGLAAEGFRMAVCTNKPAAAARALLDATGLLPFMAAVGAGDSFPVRKPDPRHLLATVEAAGGEGGRSLMVGDHANDVLAAKGAGTPCVFAAWGYGAPSMAEGAAAIAHDIHEMAAISRRLLPRG